MDAARPGIEAVRRYLRPFLAIQATAVVLLILYYRWPAFQGFCETLARLKAAGGLPYAGVTSALAGVIIPETAKVVLSGEREFPSARLWTMGFCLGFFGLNGMMVDLFYQLQAVIFGSGNDWKTLSMKIAFDQFVYTPCFATPFGVIAFGLWANRFHFGRTLHGLTPGFFKRKILPILIPSWCYWIPMVACIYAMPAGLQYTLFLMAFGAWSLIFVFMVNGNTKREEIRVSQPSAPNVERSNATKVR